MEIRCARRAGVAQRSRWTAVGLCFLLGTLGCSPALPPPAPLPPITQPQGPTTRKQAFAQPALGSVIAGRVLYTGKAVRRKVISTKGRTRFPVRLGSEEVLVNPDGTLKNVVIYVKKGLPAKTYPISTKPLILDANSYRFDPHVLAIQAGQSLLLRNADPDYHDWRISGKTCGPLAFTQPKQGMTTPLSFKKPELGIAVGSAVFPWMSAFICVLPHPYFNVTSSAGVFRLDGLPPGTYIIEAWHEQLGTKQQTVTLGANELKQITIRY